MNIWKKIFKWYLIVGIIASYAIVYVVMSTFSYLSADFSTKVGLWGEFFPTKERRERDALQERDMRQNMNWIDKIFVAAYRGLKNW